MNSRVPTGLPAASSGTFPLKLEQCSGVLPAPDCCDPQVISSLAVPVARAQTAEEPRVPLAFTPSFPGQQFTCSCVQKRGTCAQLPASHIILLPIEGFIKHQLLDFLDFFGSSSVSSGLVQDFQKETLRDTLCAHEDMLLLEGLGRWPKPNPTPPFLQVSW